LRIFGQSRVRPLELAVAGLVALCTSVVEVFEKGAEELGEFQTVNILLGKCLSTRVRNAIVRYEPLPEWQKKSTPRLPDPYTADSVPNAQKLEEKIAF
jgi:hypothetical protein